jgi:hypothetical protein
VESCPSRIIWNVPDGAPFTRIVFHPLMLAPGESWTKLSGLRTAPAPIGKFNGNALSCSRPTVVA